MSDPKLRARALWLYCGVLILALVWCCSCTPRTSAAIPIGQPLMNDAGRIWIQFENVGGKQHAMSGEWFYYPGSRIGNITDFEAELILFNKKTNEIIRYRPQYSDTDPYIDYYTGDSLAWTPSPLLPRLEKVPARKKKGAN